MKQFGDRSASKLNQRTFGSGQAQAAYIGQPRSGSRLDKHVATAFPAMIVERLAEKDRAFVAPLFVTGPDVRDM